MLSRNLLHDIRHKARRLRQVPGTTLAALLTMAFGSGAASAIGTFVQGVLLRLPPLPQQDHLTPVRVTLPGTDRRSRLALVVARRRDRFTRDPRSSRF